MIKQNTAACLNTLQCSAESLAFGKRLCVRLALTDDARAHEADPRRAAIVLPELHPVSVAPAV